MSKITLLERLARECEAEAARLLEQAALYRRENDRQRLRQIARSTHTAATLERASKACTLTGKHADDRV